MADDGSAGDWEPETPRTHIETFCQLEALDSIRDEWEALAGPSGGPVALTFEYVAAGWRRTKERNPAAQLNVIAITKGGELLAIWPLYIEFAKGVKIARHLGCGAREEYAGALIVDDERADGLAERLLDWVETVVDVLEVYNVPVDHPLTKVIERSWTLRHRSKERSPVLSAPLTQTWDEWLASRSKSFRSGLRQDRKRLSAIGEVRFVKLTQPPSIKRAVNWLFDVKRASLLAHGVNDVWVFEPGTEEFFEDAIATSNRVNLFALMVGETIAAACIIYQTPGLAEYFMTAYNHDLQLYSPGNLLLESLIQGCFGAKDVFDTRITHEAYKLRWTDAAHRYNTYVIATTRRGTGRVLAHIRKRETAKFKIATKARLAALNARLKK